MIYNSQKHFVLSCLLFLCIIPFHFLQAQTRNQLSLSPSILEGYKAKGYIEFVDDNPYLSGTGLPSNDINGKIQVLTEFFEVDAKTSALWEQWVNGVKTNTNTLTRADLEPLLNLSEGAPKLYSTDYSLYYNKFIQKIATMQLSGASFTYPETDANGNWKVIFGYAGLRGPFSYQGMATKYAPAWGEYMPTGEGNNDLIYKTNPNLPHTSIASGHVMKPGRYWLIIDYDYIFPVIIRPQAPHVEGVKVPLRDPISINSANCGPLNYTQSIVNGDSYCFQTGNGLLPEYNYAGVSPDTLTTKDTRLKLKGTVGGIFSTNTVNINLVSERVLAEDKLPDVVKIHAKVTHGSTSTIFSTTPDANGKWTVELQGIEEVGTPYLVTVYGENKYGDLGEEIIFNVFRETPVVPFAVNQIQGIFGMGDFSYFQGLLRDGYDAIYTTGTPTNLRGTAAFNSNVNVKIFPVSPQRNNNLSSVRKYQFEINSRLTSMQQEYIERNTTSDAKGNWSVTIDDSERINYNIVLNNTNFLASTDGRRGGTGNTTYLQFDESIIYSQNQERTIFKLNVEHYFLTFFSKYKEEFGPVDAGWSQPDMVLETYGIQGNLLANTTVPNMKLNFDYNRFSTNEYELPNTVDGERVYRYEFSWQHPDTNEKITISLKNIGLENFQTFNILQL